MRLSRYGAPVMVKSSSNLEMSTTSPPERDYRFKYIIICLCLTLSLSAVEFVSISTALPTIVADLKGDQFIWVTSSYALASAAVIPLIGGLAEIFGRKPITLLVISCFALGSVICGAARSIAMLIIGRTIQGLGGGAIVVITNIILADMVPLEERGGYGGLFSLTWSFSASVAVLIGGVLSQVGQWRWLFYANLPVCAVSFILAAVYMKLPKPPGTWREKLTCIDWIGNFLIIASSTAITFALTDGGVNFPWTSFHILLPLLLGFAGLVVFFVYEAIYAVNPMVPFSILNNRNSLSGYLQTFLHSIAAVAAIYYVPVYFQSVKLETPLLSGVLSLGLTVIALFAVLGGISVKIFKIYRPQIWLGWCLQIIGAGLLTSIRYDNAKTVGYCIIFAAGTGINYAAQYYPIQSSLPIETNAQSLALHGFARSFAAVWGVTLGGTILQIKLIQTLPAEVVSEVGTGAGLLYAIIPRIKTFPDPLRSVLQEAFLDSLRPIWIWITVLSAIGFLISLVMEDVPMHVHTDRKWNPNAYAHGSNLDDSEQDGSDVGSLPMSSASTRNPVLE